MINLHKNKHITNSRENETFRVWSDNAVTALEGVPGTKTDQAVLLLSVLPDKNFLYSGRQVVKDHYREDSSVNIGSSGSVLRRRLAVSCRDRYGQKGCRSISISCKTFSPAPILRQ